MFHFNCQVSFSLFIAAPTTAIWMLPMKHVATVDQYLYGKTFSIWACYNKTIRKFSLMSDNKNLFLILWIWRHNKQRKYCLEQNIYLDVTRCAGAAAYTCTVYQTAKLKLLMTSKMVPRMWWCPNAGPAWFGWYPMILVGHRWSTLPLYRLISSVPPTQIRVPVTLMFPTRLFMFRVSFLKHGQLILVCVHLF
jgi:hypothetical protein